ncbi:MAG: ABC transporter permease [Anaerolineae bacterium]
MTRFLMFITAVVLIIGSAPLLVTHDPYRADVGRIFLPPSAEHWWGTDHLGRDLWSRWILGAQNTLLLMSGAGGIAISGGVALGVVVGSQRGHIGRLGRGLLSGLLAFPPIVMALLIAAPLPRGLLTIAVAAGIGQMAALAHVVAAETERILSTEYRQASRALGAGWWHTTRCCVLLNLEGTFRAVLPLTAAYGLLTASTLSFLGLGDRPDIAEWGALLAESRFYFRDMPISAIAPGLGLLMVMLSLQGMAKRSE